MTNLPDGTVTCLQAAIAVLDEDAFDPESEVLRFKCKIIDAGTTLSSYGIGHGAKRLDGDGSRQRESCKPVIRFSS